MTWICNIIFKQIGSHLAWNSTVRKFEFCNGFRNCDRRKRNIFITQNKSGPIRKRYNSEAADSRFEIDYLCKTEVLSKCLHNNSYQTVKYISPSLLFSTKMFPLIF